MWFCTQRYKNLFGYCSSAACAVTVATLHFQNRLLIYTLFNNSAKANLRQSSAFVTALIFTATAHIQQLNPLWSTHEVWAATNVVTQATVVLAFFQQNMRTQQTWPIKACRIHNSEGIKNNTISFNIPFRWSVHICGRDQNTVKFLVYKA